MIRMIFGILVAAVLTGAIAVAEKPKSELYVIDFYATWCVPCIQMEQQVWSHPEIKQILKQYHGGFSKPTRIDIDERTDLVEKYQINGVPTILIMDSESRVVKRHEGAMGVKELKKFLGE